MMNYQYRYIKNFPEIFRLAILLYVKYPLLLRHVEDMIFERGIDIYHETVRLWWNRFGPDQKELNFLPQETFELKMDLAVRSRVLAIMKLVAPQGN